MTTAEKHGTVTEDTIRQLVDTFYDKVRRDPELGPVFEAAIHDWPPHLEKMYAFWSSVMLGSGRYKGNPLARHMGIGGMRLELFADWLRLFHQTAAELFDEPVSAVFREKAERIAESLKLALFYRPDRPWPPQTAA